jgi:hypothetical protein
MGFFIDAKLLFILFYFALLGTNLYLCCTNVESGYFFDKFCTLLGLQSLQNNTLSNRMEHF